MLHVLVVIEDLKSIVIDLHGPVLWILTALKTRSDEAIVDKFASIFHGEEETNMISMSMSVKLSTDYVRVAISQCIESHRPIIQGTSRRNMPDYVHQLLLLLRLLELAFNPL